MGRRRMDAAGDGALGCLRARGPPHGGTGSHQTLEATGLRSMRAGGPVRLLAAQSPPPDAGRRPPRVARRSYACLPATRSLPAGHETQFAKESSRLRPSGPPAGWRRPFSSATCQMQLELGLAFGWGGLCGVRIRLGSSIVVLAVPLPAEGKLVDQSRDLEQALDGELAGRQRGVAPVRLPQ